MSCSPNTLKVSPHTGAVPSVLQARAASFMRGQRCAPTHFGPLCARGSLPTPQAAPGVDQAPVVLCEDVKRDPPTARSPARGACSVVSDSVDHVAPPVVPSRTLRGHPCAGPSPAVARSYREPTRSRQWSRHTIIRLVSVSSNKPSLKRNRNKQAIAFRLFPPPALSSKPSDV